MKARKKETVPEPKKPAPRPPVKKGGKTEAAPEPEIRDVNPPMPEELIKKIAGYFAEIKSMLENYSVPLRPDDRRHLNGVGIPTRGFIQSAYEIAIANSQLLPHHVPFEKFKEDYNYFESLNSLISAGKLVRETLWNITLLAADTAYADARAFYNSARMSAESKIESSRTIYEELFPFFKRAKRAGAGPTQKEAISDFKAVLHGKRDGEVSVRSVKPKVLKGRRDVTDEEFTTNHTNGHELKN
jgi:hypothetical protein